MARRFASFFPQRLSQRVPLMAYSGNADSTDMVTAEYGALQALNSTGLLAAQSIATASNTGTFAAAYTAVELQMGKWGRALRYVASGAATSTVTVTGRDYLGSRVQEQITLNGATPVLGVKAFRYIDNIAWGLTAATTIDVGWRDCFGVPFKFKQIVAETKSGVVAANAGTFVAGLATATAATISNADVRGTYLPVTVVPNGTVTFELRYVADNTNMHGNAQFAA